MMGGASRGAGAGAAPVLAPAGTLASSCDVVRRPDEIWDNRGTVTDIRKPSVRNAMPRGRYGL